MPRTLLEMTKDIVLAQIQNQRLTPAAIAEGGGAVAVECFPTVITKFWGLRDSPFSHHDL